MADFIEIIGARSHNLKNVTCRIPRGKITVVTGVSGSGKSTLAFDTLFAEGQTTIRNVSHLRHKESDRLSSIAQEWKRLGARIEELPDGLVIQGNGRLSEATVNPRDDHRIAMSLAVIGLRIPGIEIINENCVKKSFPGFWELWDRISSPDS